MLTVKFLMKTVEKRAFFCNNTLTEVKYSHEGKKPKVGDTVRIRPPVGTLLGYLNEEEDRSNDEDLKTPRWRKLPIPGMPSNMSLHRFNGMDDIEVLIISKTVIDTIEGDREIQYLCGLPEYDEYEIN